MGFFRCPAWADCGHCWLSEQRYSSTAPGSAITTRATRRAGIGDAASQNRAIITPGTLIRSLEIETPHETRDGANAPFREAYMNCHEFDTPSAKFFHICLLYYKQREKSTGFMEGQTLWIIKNKDIQPQRRRMATRAPSTPTHASSQDLYPSHLTPTHASSRSGSLCRPSL